MRFRNGILYDWQDTGVGDNTGCPDHIGTVTEVYQNSGYMVVGEGNYCDSVKKRTISINGRFIRGFITPRYDDTTVTPAPKVGGKDIKTVAIEVIAGTWGSGASREKALAAAGYNVEKVQAKVNEILNGGATKAKKKTQDQNQPTEKKVTATEKAKKYDKSLVGVYKTTAELYLRNGAGTSKKALVLIPKGTNVNMHGYYSTIEHRRWFYIQVAIDGVLYTGFSHSAYLKK